MRASLWGAPRGGARPPPGGFRPLGSVGRAGVEEPAKACLVEDRHAELLRLRGLGAGVGADDDVVGLLRHRTGRLATAAQDRLLGLVAGEALERPRDDHRLALERAVDGLVD